MAAETTSQNARMMIVASCVILPSTSGFHHLVLYFSLVRDTRIPTVNLCSAPPHLHPASSRQFHVSEKIFLCSVSSIALMLLLAPFHRLNFTLRLRIPNSSSLYLFQHLAIRWQDPLLISSLLQRQVMKKRTKNACFWKFSLSTIFFLVVLPKLTL